MAAIFWEGSEVDEVEGIRISRAIGRTMLLSRARRRVEKGIERAAHGESKRQKMYSRNGMGDVFVFQYFRPRIQRPRLRNLEARAREARAREARASLTW